MIDHAGWHKAWLQYCRLHTANKAVIERDKTTGNEGNDGQYARPGRLSAYLYMVTRNPAFARKAWSGVMGGPNRPRGRYAITSLKGPDVLNPIDEVTGLSTNSVAQNCLELIEVLEMCGDQM